MENLDALLTRQIDQLSAVEFAPDLLDRLDAGGLADKAQKIVKTLNESHEAMEALQSKGMMKTFLDSFGTSEKITANPERALIESAKFSTSLSCLLILLSKAIKNDRNLLVALQTDLVNQRQMLKHLENELAHANSLAKEQAAKMERPVKVDELVRSEVEKASSRLKTEMETMSAQLAQFRGMLEREDQTASVAEQIAQSSAANKKEFELGLKAVTDEVAGKLEAALKDMPKVPEAISSFKAEILEIIMIAKAEMRRRIWWPIGLTAICFIVLMMKILDLL